MENKVNRLLQRVPKETKEMVSKSFDIVEQILYILKRKGMSRKDLADKLGKQESEISKWMKGTHNFTLETIAKIEIALEEKIIDTPLHFEQEQQNSFKQIISTYSFSDHVQASPSSLPYLGIIEMKDCRNWESPRVKSAHNISDSGNVIIRNVKIPITQHLS